MNNDHAKLIDAVNEGRLRVDAVQQFDATCEPKWSELCVWFCACDGCKSVYLEVRDAVAAAVKKIDHEHPDPDEYMTRADGPVDDAEKARLQAILDATEEMIDEAFAAEDAEYGTTPDGPPIRFEAPAEVEGRRAEVERRVNEAEASHLWGADRKCRLCGQNIEEVHARAIRCPYDPVPLREAFEAMYRGPGKRAGSRLWARFKRFWHCLFRFHRAETVYLKGRVTLLTCECGKVFWTR